MGVVGEFRILRRDVAVRLSCSGPLQTLFHGHVPRALIEQLTSLSIITFMTSKTEDCNNHIRMTHIDPLEIYTRLGCTLIFKYEIQLLFHHRFPGITFLKDRNHNSFRTFKVTHNGIPMFTTYFLHTYHEP